MRLACKVESKNANIVVSPTSPTSLPWERFSGRVPGFNMNIAARRRVCDSSKPETGIFYAVSEVIVDRMEILQLWSTLSNFFSFAYFVLTADYR